MRQMKWCIYLATIICAMAATSQAGSVAPSVISNSIPPGAILPTGPLTDVVTFDQQMDVSVTTASGIDLVGIVRGVNYVPASFSWDPTDTILTVNYASLPTDNYSLELVASDFAANLTGLNLASNFTVDFSIPPVPTVPEPSSLLLIVPGLLGVIGVARRKVARLTS
jgi:PEP-CTERM motif